MQTLLKQFTAPPKKAKTLQDSLTEVNGHEALIIYRGESLYHGEYQYEEVSSWTLDEDIAHWWCSLHGSEVSRVYKAKIKTEDVTIYENKNGDREILVNIDNLSEVEIIFDYGNREYYL